MNKFIKRETTRVRKKIVLEPTVEVKETKPEREIIKKGDKEFIICPRCGWQHSATETRCRFCGKKL